MKHDKTVLLVWNKQERWAVNSPANWPEVYGVYDSAKEAEEALNQAQHKLGDGFDWLIS